MTTAIRKRIIRSKKLDNIATKTVVVKVGGSVLQDEPSMNSIVEQVKSLVGVVEKVILVHGGGPHINQCLAAAGVAPRFVSGLRVTDGDTLMTVFAALQYINSRLVESFKQAGLSAVGLHAEPGLFSCQKKTAKDTSGQTLDLGWVGKIVKTDAHVLAQHDVDVVVISPMGWDSDWNRYNCNADHAALAVAVAMQADALVFISDVPGVLAQKDNPSSLFSMLDALQVEELIKTGIASGGMIPKLVNALSAVQKGVKRVAIIGEDDDSSLFTAVAHPGAAGTTILAAGTLEQSGQTKSFLKEIA